MAFRKVASSWHELYATQRWMTGEININHGTDFHIWELGPGFGGSREPAASAGHQGSCGETRCFNQEDWMSVQVCPAAQNLLPGVIESMLDELAYIGEVR